MIILQISGFALLMIGCIVVNTPTDSKNKKGTEKGIVMGLVGAILLASYALFFH